MTSINPRYEFYSYAAYRSCFDWAYKGLLLNRTGQIPFLDVDVRDFIVSEGPMYVKPE